MCDAASTHADVHGVKMTEKDAKIIFNGFENDDCLGCAILDKIKIIIEFKKDIIINRKLMHKSKDFFILGTSKIND